jgi:hypothetical protein
LFARARTLGTLDTSKLVVRYAGTLGTVSTHVRSRSHHSDVLRAAVQFTRFFG